MKPLAHAALILSLGLLTACSEAPDPKTGGPAGSGQTTGVDAGPGDFTELDWEALIPPEWRPDKLMADYKVDDLADDDPRAQELMDKLQALWQQAPVIPELDGKRVRLPGFVVPLEADSEAMGEFLLVPYYGACIHVPPPPANQTVHVVTAKGGEYHGGLFDTVWVNGILKVERLSNELGDAGYRIDAVLVEPYEGEPGIGL